LNLPSFVTTRFAVLLLATLSLNGCAGGHALVQRSAAELGRDGMAPAAVSWFVPELPDDVADLVRWRQSVGPPVVATASTPPSSADRLVVVNWNVHVGGGDIARLFADLRRQSGPNVPIVFLLQEAYRAGNEVPHVLQPSATFASLIREMRDDGRREEIETVAESLGLHAYYVPSMRNGGPLASDEDRGNAILSTIPLEDLSAIELPFERQRRVAVAATVSCATTNGQPWRVRVVSAHFDTMSGARRLWIAGSEFARARQARGLLTALRGEESVILGADMNTMFGFRDRAYAEAARAFPDTQVTDRRATFHGLMRLDHLLFRLPDGWHAEFRRLDDPYGSDHHPLVGHVTFASNATTAIASANR
jgi:endonuclease/exonuclease/phosphatase family metal-dependent hydrolase